MTYYLFNKDITPENFQELASEVNQEITIYFSSDGGDSNATPLYLDFFRNEGSLIELVGFGDIFSAGFEVFFLAEVKSKRLLSYCSGMYHGGYVEVKLNEKGLPLDGAEQVKLNNNLTCSRDLTLKVINALPLTSAEKKLILNGQDVFFDNHRMQKLLK